MKDKALCEMNGYLITIKDEDMVKHTITSYLKMQVKAQIHLKQPHIDHICSKELCSYVHEYNNVLLNKMKLFHCRIEYYRIQPDFCSLTFDKNTCTAKVISKETLKFDKLKDETLRFNTHEFELSKVNNKWLIISDIDNTEKSFRGNSKEQHKKYSLSLEFQMSLLKKMLKKKLSKENYLSDDNDRALDRAKMKLYQIENWNKRPKEWGNFNEMGGDCTNYVSQVVYAGGAPMITNGSFKWYYYGYGNRTPSWTGVEQFYDFLTKNNAQGIHGIELPTNLDLKTGDVIQLDLDGDGVFNHTSVVYNPTGYMGVLPTITSHSLDRFNEPILTFNFTNIRWIHLKS